MKKTILIALPFVCAGFAQLPAQSSIASFGGDYVSTNQSSQAPANQNILGAPTASDSIRQIGGFGVTANPTIGVDYTGPEFFAGAQAVKIGENANTGVATAEIVNDGSTDHLRLFAQTPNGVSAGSSLNYVFRFDVADTLYSNLTSFSGQTAGGVAGSLVSRFMVETTEGDIYLSDTSISGGFGGATWSISDLTTENWALFTPGTDDWSGDFGTIAFNTVLSSQTINSVGWFASRPVTSGTNSALTIREFDVSAIPEPSAYALLAGLLGLGCVALRRRRS